jgi:putative lipase involved disintegration of autophagic bodies
LVYKREKRITSKIQDCVRKLKSKLKYDDIGDQKVYKNVYETLCKYEKKKENNINNSNNNIINNFIGDNNIINNFIGDNNIINNFINNFNNNNHNQNIYTFENIERKIRDMIVEDDEKIKEQIKEFDLNFTSVSELNTDDGGSSCGMFWSDKENCIIIAFKGTSTTNFAEWLSNLTFQCVDARNYLFGQVHKGFYDYLFPIDEESAGKNYPCQKIIEAINCKATTLKNKNDKKVNLWITGHSLGGALATLFYARLLNINYSHESWELQGAVTFASPAVGDINFSTQLASLINDPRNLTKPLWRIVLNNDIVPKLPYRACNKRMKKYGYHYNVLMNYAQVGDKVTFYSGDRDPSSIKEFFSNASDTDNNIGEHVNRLKSYCKNYCKVKKTDSIFRYFSYRHSAKSYFRALIEYENKIGKK